MDPPGRRTLISLPLLLRLVPIREVIHMGHMFVGSWLLEMPRHQTSPERTIAKA
jgi:hypothetical protein